MRSKAKSLGTVAVAAIALAGGAAAQVDTRRAKEPVARFDGQRVVRVQFTGDRELQTVLSLTDDVWTESIPHSGPIDVRVTPAQFAALAATGLPFRVLVNDVQALIDRESAEIRAHAAGDDPGWYTSYHNYADTRAYVQALAAAYPGLATYTVLGQSLEGRDIFGLRITGPGSAAERPAGFWWGGQHAREWIAPAVTEYCAEQLLARYATDAHVQYLVNTTEFFFVPTMNPDGYDYTWTTNRFWRKNRRPNAGTGCTGTFGVDLNRNWGYQWGIVGPYTSANCADDTFYGSAAFSEPETQVMRDFILANPRLKLTMDWHSYGQLILSPWGYTSSPVTPPSVAAMFGAMDQQMASAIFAVHGMEYTPGQWYQTLYPASGTAVDWSYGARGNLAFTIELRDTGASGFTLPAAQITPTCEECWGAFLVMADAIAPCYANCDGSTTAPALNIADFTCFLQRYASGDAYANCDASTAPPTLNVADFTCYLQKYAAGCP